MLEALDAFRLVQCLRSTDPEGDSMKLLHQYADLHLLSRGYSIFVLRTVNDSGVCVFLNGNDCRIYPAHPRTCRLYPFSLEPKESTFQWHLCLEQEHHFHGGHLTAREWGRKNMSDEDRAFLLEEARILPKLGEVMRRISNKHLGGAEILAVRYTYYAYNYGQPFMPQYQRNMTTLLAQLEKLASASSSKAAGR